MTALEHRGVPVSRRPIADIFRATARRATALCVRRGVHPDVVSWLSMLFAGAASLAFLASSSHPAFLLLAVACCYIRLWLNMLDGMVALASGKASRWGEIVNDLPDRFSDVIIFVGVAHSAHAQVVVAYWVAMAALVTAYVGVSGQAIGVGRPYGGVMAKPWRMVALHIGAWLTLADLWWGDGIAAIGASSWTWLDGIHVVILIGCAQTIWVRLAAIRRASRVAESGP